ncbi:hypothetical protein [Ornithinimicrobium sp. INDO-MA30-4]|uniref:hypothetical protein n=1 Tax=Ornithinimicrobium sp. INDO-MA30-4 TaxID=2908651 RepID=UPI001F440DD6|nr:hypothetical protein [Ornithinimicrobium sp. INDO-MA30-4]UJH71788.1 hypothetical protein L0A91_16345 [Ornithinimicrobium sp. INDO-MA30-4]
MFEVGRASRGAVWGAWVSTVWMVVVVLSLVLMHGLGLSHTGTAPNLAAPTVAAASHASEVATSGGHGGPTVPAAGRIGHQEPGPGHSTALAQACLAVLTALILVGTFLLLMGRGWARSGRRLRELVASPFWDPAMWWVHPRTHELCVMRT